MHLNRVTLKSEAFPTFECYPFNVEAIRRTKQIIFESPVTFFVGENGTGKATLLRAITQRCGIHIWENPDCGRARVNRYEDALCRYLEIEWAGSSVPGSFFSSEHFRYFSERVEDWAGSDRGLFNYFGGKSLLSQSHGQSLLSFFRSRYRIEGLYFLDEPDTALSPRRQIELLRLLHEMADAGHAQFVVATHSPILMSCPEAVILSFDQAPIVTVDYEDTQHFKDLRDFMAHPDKYRP